MNPRLSRVHTSPCSAEAEGRSSLRKNILGQILLVRETVPYIETRKPQTEKPMENRVLIALARVSTLLGVSFLYVSAIRQQRCQRCVVTIASSLMQS